VRGNKNLGKWELKTDAAENMEFVKRNEKLSQIIRNIKIIQYCFQAGTCCMP
jgi:hypothetical protein